MAAAPRIQAPTRLKKRAVPDDALVYREYAHQVMSGGEWGAYSRTGRVCKVSHEHVRKVVVRHGPKKVEPKKELAYQPAPGEIEYHAARTSLASHDFLCQLLTEEVALEARPITSTPSLPAIASDCMFASLEPERALPAYDLFCNRTCIDRRRENHRTSVWLLSFFILTITILTILLAQKSLGLSLALLPEVLGLWWILLEYRRVVY